MPWTTTTAVRLFDAVPFRAFDAPAIPASPLAQCEHGLWSARRRERVMGLTAGRERGQYVVYAAHDGVGMAAAEQAGMAGGGDVFDMAVAGPVRRDGLDALPAGAAGAGHDHGHGPVRIELARGPCLLGDGHPLAHLLRG